MEQIKRDLYLKKLISNQNNGLIKVITGIRRVGKSYLLNNIFYNYLIESDVKEDNIITFSFDKMDNIMLLDSYLPNEETIIKVDKEKRINERKFILYIKDKIKNDDIYYLLFDEIQLLNNFEFVLNSYIDNPKMDVYVTGSNSKFLSSDIITEFRGRSSNIYVSPLTFKEYCSYLNLDKFNKVETLNNYLLYGGLPLTLLKETDEEKSQYLKELFSLVYKKDIIDCHNITRSDALDEILNFLSSITGSLTNIKKISDTFLSKGEKEMSFYIVNLYVQYLIDAYLISKADRFDIAGKQYIASTVKYFYTDLGLRNARLNFKNYDIDRMIENCVYNELIYREYNVDIGIIETREENIRKQLEVDFIANKGNKRYYIQVTLSLFDETKRDLEKKSLTKIKDSYKKIIIVYDDIKLYRDENGFLIMSIYDFLLNENSLDL